MARGAYSTKQSSSILSFVETLKGHFTASDVYEHFRKTGNPVGSATVYRQLDRLVSEGLVNRYVIDEGSSCCYEYVCSHSHSKGESCYHCKCEKCGKLIHLDCDEVSRLRDHILSDHGFMIDTRKTVFYGLCKECANA